MNDAREFWIRKDEIDKIGDYKFTAAELSIIKPDMKNLNHIDFKDAYHVIEHSAYLAEKARADKAERMLEKCKTHVQVLLNGRKPTKGDISNEALREFFDAELNEEGK